MSCMKLDQTVIIPGGSDKKNRPIILVTVPSDITNVDITAPLKYLLSIFSSATQTIGFTVILDARKGLWRVCRNCIKQVLNNFPESSLKLLLVIKPDGFWDKQRVENCTIPNIDQEVIFIGKSKLKQFIDPIQLPIELGGSLQYDHDKWIDNRQRVEEFYNDAELTLKELEDLQRHVLSSQKLPSSQIEEAINISCDMEEATRMLVHNVIETGRELVQAIEEENRTKKLSMDHIFTPKDTLDTIDAIHEIVKNIKQKQQEIETSSGKIETNLIDTKYLNNLKKKVVKVTNWILGPAEQLMNTHQKVGYDVSSAEELRLEHETIELQCWETYGNYAEILHKIELLQEDSEQIKVLISQKEFMDFVCKSFALRIEKRRNILITSLRFFRLVSEYFDKTGEVFDSLVMGSDLNDFQTASAKLNELEESRVLLDSIADEIKREGEKLSDMLSMPIKDALGQSISVDYSEDIVNIHDVLDATVARKNIFSVELQKITLQQISLIDQYETDAQQAIDWLQDILRVMLKDHSHVGCSVHEIQSQKEQQQIFQETAKCANNYGVQLLNASLMLRQSCKLSLNFQNKLFGCLNSYWQRIDTICQEQMTRLRVSAVFYRSIEDQCNRLRDLREAVATLPLLNLIKKRLKVQSYFENREALMIEVGRMVRLGRLLRSRLKEPLYEEEAGSGNPQFKVF